MKKSLVALAALAVVGVASAQSSVTLFGVVDAAVSGFSNKSKDANRPTLENLGYLQAPSAKVKQTVLRNSGYNSSRLGFRGVEDLGGGLAASFWLEAALGNDDGTAGGNVSNSGSLNGLFNRRSTVSLSGAFGEVRLGRDYTPTFWNDTVFDPFGTNGVGTNLISTANGYNTPGSAASGFTANNNYVRASNSIGYFLPPNLGGVYGQFMYAFNEKTSYDPGGLTPPGIGAVVANPTLADVGRNERAGRYIGGRVGYASGPLDVALAYSQSTISSNYFGGTTDNLNTWNLGASYDFGMVKLFGEYSKAKLKQDSSLVFIPTDIDPYGFRQPGAAGWLLGATMPVGPGLIRVSYSAVDYKRTSVWNDLTGFAPEPKANKFALGYVHNLSKRTALYTTVAYLKNKNGADLSVGGPAFYTKNSVNGRGDVSDMRAKTSTGYDIGIRHSF
ncbi:porin [Variovorax sp. J22P168]|uniref:porin n=1 Tax=Variovorax jilinensis TaxID=3053513 RepID=UPI00257557FA|nr:porin [Variovorax sp. J22P168]MDM0012484.1 porin [Variovorax sp. J22P168]